MNYSIQTGEAIVYIHVEDTSQHGDRYNVQLFHQQLVKGIPSFRLQDIECVMQFINGFLFGELAISDYSFYCDAMESVFSCNPQVLKLFNVKTRAERSGHLISDKNPLDNRRAIR